MHASIENTQDGDTGHGNPPPPPPPPNRQPAPTEPVEQPKK